ncbi:MAG: hypothetical protein GTO45_04135 [Candidatus Aminicenantes bacterium]|nr:hypothetical protein [Candidatus Aminicenantes bacterium]NIM77917.1 hypothetical protein [Candidatus Aminicenantes bacterium]NIN17234.1 hypothetical protein [Candidatus Aminicenantes bacterium]NIN41121.1 hypothetical protein [Candidatus Aminicenantes bacterium]NIN83927.1 hypothetical protein [Candidatus Aminicenantes bacterium]
MMVDHKEMEVDQEEMMIDHAEMEVDREEMIIDQEEMEVDRVGVNLTNTGYDFPVSKDHFLRVFVK